MDVKSGYVLVVTCVVLCRILGHTRALILKRDEEEEEGPGLWTIPGGRVEEADWGEPARSGSHTVWQGILARAAAREVREETGIFASPDMFSRPGKDDVVFIRKNGMPTLVLRNTLALAKEPVVMVGDGATGYRWICEEEISAYRFIGRVGETIRAAMREHTQEGTICTCNATL